ncbi:unnamed protein product [Kuraishia capsulata CBS 1993]|uniref:Glycine cleavage system H protein n=1 Tax=Kuraishia capsulata CBS 1993 TaxID=1382522 RepID=W6MWU7_9ASCO|nr:uncharacterized protein KUCA_T00003865001 [Kuraishia capsulata CBS 1993]CDK27885.1 unnamed protein product [Kuraishia capsulata CBS 1993]
MFNLSRVLITRSTKAPVRAALAQSFPVFARRFNSTNTVNPDSVVFKYSESGPLKVKYTPEHEWIAYHQDGTAFIGITSYAADSLGDATYIELPEITEDSIEQGDTLGSVESVKSASEIYSPVSGIVTEVNEKLHDSPELINEDPMGAGWIVKVKLANEAELDEGALLDTESYQEFLKQDAEEH